jgi:hypothetical protein
VITPLPVVAYIARLMRGSIEVLHSTRSATAPRACPKAW